MYQNRRFENAPQKKGVSSPERGGTRAFSGLDPILHAIAFAFDKDGLGMMQEEVEQSRGESADVIEDLRPLLEHPIGCDDDGAAFIALAVIWNNRSAPVLSMGKYPSSSRTRTAGLI